MDIVKSVATFVLMMGVIFLVIALLAGLFMIVFSIATGVDEHLQE